MLQTSSNSTDDPEEQCHVVWEELRRRRMHAAEATPEQTQFNGDECSYLYSKRRKWPTYDTVMGDMTSADYNHTLKCPLDILELGAKHQDKTLCPHGAVCKIRIQIFPGHDYTGLLSPGTITEHAILRLSTAMKPPNEEIKSSWARALLYATGEKLRNAKLFPCAAIKVFRKGVHSGNLLFGGSKIGQREPDFFAHCMSTTMTEQMPRTVRPFVRKFWQYSDYPLSLGISDYTAFDQDGVGQTDNHFPFVLVLRPRRASTVHEAELPSAADDKDSFDIFLDQTLRTPEGTALFDLFAVETPGDVPDASKLQRIGVITTMSPMVESGPSDGLFFRHQRKEEDYHLRPSWKKDLSRHVELDQGRTKGTIGRLAGWKLFEQHIRQGIYKDHEV